MLEFLTQLLAAYMALLALMTGGEAKLGVALPLTDYKFRYIMRDDNGFITEAAIKFYEGAITTENEKQKDFTLVPITRYRRTRVLSEVDLPKTKKFKLDFNGNPMVIYTPADFGNIKTNDDLRIFLNRELAKDTTRTSINEQK